MYDRGALHHVKGVASDLIHSNLGNYHLSCINIVWEAWHGRPMGIFHTPRKMAAILHGFSWLLAHPMHSVP